MPNFKTLALSARKVYESDEINKVYDALDELNLSDKSKEDVQKFTDLLKNLTFSTHAYLHLVQGAVLTIMNYKMGIANKTIEECATAAELPIEEVEASAFGMMDMMGKFVAGVVVIMSVVDVIMSIYNIIDVVEKTKKMVDELENTIKPSYKSYFNGIKEASKAYNKAISEKK